MTVDQSNRPSDWGVSTILDGVSLLMDYRGRTPKKLGMSWGGGTVRAISARNVKMNRIDFTEECYLGSMKLYRRWMGAGDMASGDVLFTTEAPLGNVAAVPDAQKYILSQRTVLLRPNPALFDNVFFLKYLQGPSFQRALLDNATGSTALGIQRRRLERLVINQPSLAEQRAIGGILQDQDDLIGRLDGLIAKKQGIKQGMMQQLLTGRTRLPGFDRPWSESSIGDLAQIVSGGTPKSSVSNYWNGGVAWCTPTDITHQKGRFLCATERTISQEGLEHSAAQLLPAGSLLLCTRATIGEVKIATRPIATNQGFKSLIPRARVSGEYLYYKVLTLKDDLVAKGTGSTFLEVSKRDVAALKFEVPGYDEQIAIASVLNDADDELTLLRERLIKARAIKQGMMQELLTGRTRLPVEAFS